MNSSIQDPSLKPVVEYEPSHAGGRNRRGVLISSHSTSPAVSWGDLNYALDSIHGAVNPNVVRFRAPPSLHNSNLEAATIELQAAFAIHFPAASLPDVRLSTPRPGFKYIDIETPYDNVQASEIVKVASTWKVFGLGLGEAQLTGLPSAQTIHCIRFDKIPLTNLDNFIAYLPTLFRTIEPTHAINFVDIWKKEYRLTFASPHQHSDTWVFGNSIVVVFSLPPLTNVAEVVDKWPGWWLWRENAIGMVYPGRYEYCTFCKYTAQMLTGPDRRHTTKMCRKLICMKCGKRGHYDTTCKSVYFHKGDKAKLTSDVAI